jgi:hypothetical protein
MRKETVSMASAREVLQIRLFMTALLSVTATPGRGASGEQQLPAIRCRQERKRWPPLTEPVHAWAGEVER